MKKLLLILLISFTILLVPAFEDYIITTKGKLTNITLEDNTMVNVYPLITIMNDKNTLMVTPFKVGKTSFSVLRNNKEQFIFNLDITETKTTIDKVKGFEILSLDGPFEDYDLDEPPMLKEVN